MVSAESCHELMVGFSCRVSVEARSSRHTVSTSCRALIRQCGGSPRAVSAVRTRRFPGTVSKLSAGVSPRAAPLLVSVCQWVLCNQS